MSIRPIGSDSQNTILNTSQTEVPLQTVEASPEPAADDGLRIEAQWHNQLQRLHVLARLAQSTNGQTSGPGVSRPQADATAKKTVDEQAAAPNGPQKTDGGKAPKSDRKNVAARLPRPVRREQGGKAPKSDRKNVAAASIDGKTSDPIVLQLEVTAARAPASAEALRYLLACELVEAVYRQAGIQISRAAAEAVAVRLLARGIDFTGRRDRNGQLIWYPQDGLLPQPERRADGKLVYRFSITKRGVDDLLAYRALAEEVSRSGALSMRESDLLMRVKRALEIALERGYLPEELRRALREQVSLDQLTALLVTGATLGVLERAGLRGVAGWIGIALEAKQDLELLMAWEEFLAACARARSEEELDQAARLGGRFFGELGATAVVQAALKVGKLVGRVGAHAASERLSRMAVERLDELHGGHSLRRHGAHLSDQELLERLTKGKVPGEGGRVQKHAVSASTRFASSRLQVQTYRKAIDLFIKQRGELTVPPRPNEKPKQTLIIEWDRPIDEGFVGVGQKVKLANGQRVWAQTAAVDGITRTLTTFEWNAQEGRWKVVQHFPLAKGWDNTTKSYDPKQKVNFVGIPVD